MMFIYKITEVQFCMSLRKYHDLSVSANDAAANTQSLRPHRKLILTDILLKIEQINLQMIHIKKIEKKAF